MLSFAAVGHSVVACATTEPEAPATPAVAPTPLVPAFPAGGPPSLAPARLDAVRAQEPARAQSARLAWLSDRARLARPDGSDLRIARVETDRQGITHTRLQITVDGVPLHGSDMIAHIDASGSALVPTLPDGWKSPAVEHATARIDEAEAIQIATGGALTLEPPRARLYYYPVVPGAPWKLVYLVTALVAQGNDVRHWLRLVSAESGTVLDTKDVTQYGTGFSRYSGTVTFPTRLNAATGLYEASDDARGGADSLFNRVLLFRGNDAPGVLYTNGPFDIWGTGTAIECTTLASCMTQAAKTTVADAGFGVLHAWNVYVAYGRPGPIGGNPAQSVRAVIHWPNDNALGAGHTIILGDGVPGAGAPYTSVDTIGHEMGHLFFNAATGWTPTPTGVMAALGEANADIMGQLTEFHENAVRDPNDLGFYKVTNWTIAEQVRPPNGIRNLYRPSLDGQSFDYVDSPGFSPDGDPHLVSGPIRRAFYFLVHGAPPEEPGVPSDYTTTKIPEGFPGIGVDWAALLWMDMVSNRLTTITDFVGARQALLRSANASGTCTEAYKSTEDAFAAVGVGTKADRIKPVVTLTVTQSDDLQTLTYDVVASDSGGIVELTLEDTRGYSETISWGTLHREFQMDGSERGLRFVTVAAKDRCGNVGNAFAGISVQWPPTDVVIVPSSPTGKRQKSFSCPTCPSINSGVFRVEYYGDLTRGIQGGETLLGTATADRPWPITKNFTEAQQGKWWIYGIARQSGGLFTISDEIKSYVDSTPPDITRGWVERQVLRPDGPREVTVNVSVNDNLRVEKCEFTGLGSGTWSDINSTCSTCDVNPNILGVTMVTQLPEGHYTITAKCFDMMDSFDTHSIPVTLGDGTPPPPPRPCNEVVNSGGNQPQVWEVDLGRRNGTVDFGRRTYTVPDRFLVRCRDGGMFGPNGEYESPCDMTGNLWRFAADHFTCNSNFVEIEVIPNCAGTPNTLWDFQMNCPR